MGESTNVDIIQNMKFKINNTDKDIFDKDFYQDTYNFGQLLILEDLPDRIIFLIRIEYAEDSSETYNYVDKEITVMKYDFSEPAVKLFEEWDGSNLDEQNPVPQLKQNLKELLLEKIYTEVEKQKEMISNGNLLG